jgi:hypothetical protein
LSELLALEASMATLSGLRLAWVGRIQARRLYSCCSFVSREGGGGSWCLGQEGFLSTLHSTGRALLGTTSRRCNDAVNTHCYCHRHATWTFPHGHRLMYIDKRLTCTHLTFTHIITQKVYVPTDKLQSPTHGSGGLVLKDRR